MKNGSVLLSELENKYGKQMVAEELLHTLLELRKSGELTDEEIKILLERDDLYNLISRMGGKGSEENKMRKALAALEKEEEEEGGGKATPFSKLRKEPRKDFQPTTVVGGEEIGQIFAPKGEEGEEGEEVPAEEVPPPTTRVTARERERPKGEEGGLRTRERPVEDTPGEDPLEIPQEKSSEVSVRIGASNLNLSQISKISQDYQDILLDPEVVDRPMVSRFLNNFRELTKLVRGDEKESITEKNRNASFLNSFGFLIASFLSPGITSPEKLEEQIRDIVYDLLNEITPGGMRQTRAGRPLRRRFDRSPQDIGTRIPVPLGREGQPLSAEPAEEGPSGPAFRLASLGFKNQDIERISLSPVFTQFASQNKVELFAVHKALRRLLEAVDNDKREREAGVIRDTLIILNMLFKTESIVAAKKDVARTREKYGGQKVAESKRLQNLKNKIYRRLMNELQGNK